MQFHGGMSIGHLHSQASRPSSPSPVPFETPMDVDPPTFDDLSASDGSITDSEDELDNDRRCVGEPDSKDEPDIYE